MLLMMFVLSPGTDTEIVPLPVVFHLDSTGSGRINAPHGTELL